VAGQVRDERLLLAGDVEHLDRAVGRTRRDALRADERSNVGFRWKGKSGLEVIVRIWSRAGWIDDDRSRFLSPAALGSVARPLPSPRRKADEAARTLP
jgi:hypothetical protein